MVLPPRESRKSPPFREIQDFVLDLFFLCLFISYCSVFLFYHFCISLLSFIIFPSFFSYLDRIFLISFNIYFFIHIFAPVFYFLNSMSIDVLWTVMPGMSLILFKGIFVVYNLMISAIFSIFPYLPFLVSLLWLIVFAAHFRSLDLAKRILLLFAFFCTSLYFCHALFFTGHRNMLFENVWSFCSLSVYPLYYIYVYGKVRKHLWEYKSFCKKRIQTTPIVNKIVYLCKNHN